MLHGSEGCSCRSCSFPSPNGAIWHESPALKSVESTDTLGCLRCVVRRLGKEGGWAPPEGSMQNRNTWAAHRFPPVSSAVGMIYKRPSQLPAAPDQGDRGRGGEMQVTPACSLSCFLGKTVVYLQTAGGLGWACKHHQEASWLGSTKTLE